MANASTNKRTMSAIIIKFGIDSEIAPQLRYFAGPFNEIADNSIVFLLCRFHICETATKALFTNSSAR